MRPALRTLSLVLSVAAPLAFAALGCGKMTPRSLLTANQPPVITLERPTLEGGTDESRLAVRWTARDPDGRVDHYVYAVDPARVDLVDSKWTTRENEATAGCAPHGDGAPGRNRAAARGAASLRGAGGGRRWRVSDPAVVATVGDNIAPQVFIDSPQINSIFATIVPPSLKIQWHGWDDDGQVVKYQYRLFTAQNPDFPGISDFISLVMANPDTLGALYAPGFAGWDSSGPSKTSAIYQGLTPLQSYLVAVTAIDNNGDYGPVSSPYGNLLKFVVNDDASFNPRLCVSAAFFNYCESTGGDVDVAYEIPDGAGVRVQWVGIPAIARDIAGYRWVLDPLDPTDLKDRDNPNQDPNHWSGWSLGATSTIVGPFTDDVATEHVLYIQVRDDVDRRSMVRIHFTLARMTHERDLLVVDDTRLHPDMLAPDGSTAPPSGIWPTAAELDTFLYARGGYVWRGYPPGTLSPRGLMDGYPLDTLGTIGLVGGVVPLSVLGRYQHVIWFTDDVGATYTNPPGFALAPTTSLRLMSSPGAYSTLAAYVGQGGSLWLSGGGAAYATLVNWGKRNTPPDDWTNADLELIPGRFMYDAPHWQSAIAVRPGRQGLINTPDFAPWDNAALGRGWSGQGMDHSLTQPNYTKLIADPVMNVLRGRTCATDPPPPLRVCNSFYLVPSYPAEYIGRNPQFGPVPNFIREDADPRPNHEDIQSTLDTLYTAVGGSIPGALPVMTYTMGSSRGRGVLGFPFWFFQKQQATKLVDFVLQTSGESPGSRSRSRRPLRSRQKGVISATTLTRKTGPLSGGSTLAPTLGR
jgi:hypothetical protein